MSEADRPTNPSPSGSADANLPVPEPIDSSPPHLGDDEGWETVNLPNTISIDALALPSDNSQQNALALPFEGGRTPGGLATTPPPAWNPTDLVDRIAKLEIAIQEYRDRLGQDQARFDAQRQLLAQRTIELKAANEQIEVQNRHIEALEAQTTQQQSTIDSLTTEVESLSQQIAQIERECALTQQRYTQESQLRQKAEISIQELRSRLHRQQHHTLQFKAALEKCLEVPLTPDTTANASTPEANPSIFPKAPSIQPWSPPPATASVGTVGTAGTVASVAIVGTVSSRGALAPVSQGTGETTGLGDGGAGDGEQGSKGAREQGSKGERAKALTPIPSTRGGEGGLKPSPPSPRPGGERGESPLTPIPSTRGGEGGLKPSPPSPRPGGERGESPPAPRPPISPSPLVYPKDANVKKRRSLAAVQLPNFAT